MSRSDLEENGTRIILGVGRGDGNLFVEGDYDSITRVQNMIFELEELRRENHLLKKAAAKRKETDSDLD